MRDLRFNVVLQGRTYSCGMTVNAAGEVKALSASPALPTYDGEVWKRVLDRVHVLGDLIHAGVPFEALASCRRSVGLNGNIVDAICIALEENGIRSRKRLGLGGE